MQPIQTSKKTPPLIATHRLSIFLSFLSYSFLKLYLKMICIFSISKTVLSKFCLVSVFSFSFSSLEPMWHCSRGRTPSPSWCPWSITSARIRQCSQVCRKSWTMLPCMLYRLIFRWVNPVQCYFYVEHFSELPQTESSSNPRAMLDLSCHPRPPPKSLPAQRGTHLPRSPRRPRNPRTDDELMKIGRDSLPMASPKYRQQHSVKHCTHFRRGLNSVSY